MEPTHLPIIDWELSTKLAGNKKDLAKEMLELFVNTIPKEFSVIKQCYIDKNHADLARHVHRLHGALCYCGLPRLKRLVAQFETEMKNNNKMVNFSSFIQNLEMEINLLLEHFNSALF